MGVFSASAGSQLLGFFTGRRPNRAASPRPAREESDACAERTIGPSIPEDGFRAVSEFDGKMLEAMFTEAGGGGGAGAGGGGDGGLEMEENAKRPGGEGSRSWGTDYGAAASAVAALDVRTLTTRASVAVAVASGDLGADGLFDQDNADGWTELLQNAGAPRESFGFDAGFADDAEDGRMTDPESGEGFPNLRGRGHLPDLSEAIGASDGLRQRVADFMSSGRGGADAGFLVTVEREVTGILYGWAGIDGVEGGAADRAQASFLDSYFGNASGVGIANVLPPEEISGLFDEVRDAAMLKLAGQGPVAGLFRDLSYDADADRLTGSAAMDRNTLTAFGSSAATLGPDGEAGAWRALAELTHSFEAVLGSSGALTTLFTDICGRGAELAGRVGEGMRVFGIDPGGLKVKLPGSEDAGEEGGSTEDDGSGSELESTCAGEADSAPDGHASVLNRDACDPSQDWSVLPGGSGTSQGFGGLFGDYPADRSQSWAATSDGFQWQSAALFQIPSIAGFSIFDSFGQPEFQAV